MIWFWLFIKDYFMINEKIWLLASCHEVWHDSTCKLPHMGTSSLVRVTGTKQSDLICQYRSFGGAKSLKAVTITTN